MREIIFRGKGTRKGKEWKEGDLFHGYNGYVGITKKLLGVETWEVDPETVGQYTGLKDKKGKKIFEGDIIKYEHRDIKEKAVIRYGSPNKVDAAMYGWYLDDNHGNTAYLFSEHYINFFEFEVVGNIWDNPELLGGKENG